MKISDEQLNELYYAADAMDLESKLEPMLDELFAELEEKLKTERHNVKNLLEVIVDLVGDHCSSHGEPEPTCPTCVALTFVAESQYWEGQKS